MKKLMSALLAIGLLASLLIPAALTEGETPTEAAVDTAAEPQEAAANEESAATVVVETEPVEVTVNEGEVPAEEADSLGTVIPEENPAPTEDAPAEDAPVEDVPAENTPAEDVPVEEIPAEPIPEAPAEDVPVEDVPAEEVPAEELPAAPQGSVEIRLEGDAWLGGTVRLIAKVHGFEGADIALRWQFCDDLSAKEPVWRDAPGRNDQPEYELVLNETNAAYAWRVQVTATVND